VDESGAGLVAAAEVEAVEPAVAAEEAVAEPAEAAVELAAEPAAAEHAVVVAGFGLVGVGLVVEAEQCFHYSVRSA